MRTPAKVRDISGVLLLDKPAGMSSNQALQAVKRLYHARKAGHTGSLDPLATGLLIVCLGEATKVSPYLLKADKHYLTTCRLGVKTTTADAEGEIIERRAVSNYTFAHVESVLHDFRGVVTQVPPMYSAVKHAGKRLYKLARRGVEVARDPRSVIIHQLELTYASRDSMTLSIRCSKGTYVRTLVEDIGEALGCGAHVLNLRRLAISPYEAPDMIELDVLAGLAQQAFESLTQRLLPLDSAVAGWPAAWLDEASTLRLGTGQPVRVPGAPSLGKIRLYNRYGSFIGFGQVLGDGKVAPERMIRTTLAGGRKPS